MTSAPSLSLYFSIRGLHMLPAGTNTNGVFHAQIERRCFPFHPHDNRYVREAMQSEYSELGVCVKNRCGIYTMWDPV